MTLKKVTRLDEGPLDFIRGASGEAGRKVKNSGLGRAVGDVVRAGRAASAEADANALRGQLGQAVQKLGQLVARYNELNGNPQDENPQDEQRDNPMPADNGQQPHQQQTDNVSSGNTMGGQAQAFRTTTRPRGRMGQHGFEYTFDSFMHMTFDDEQQLDEGVWDFLKGAAGEGVRKMINHYQSKPSVLKDLYHAGREASAQGNIRSLQKKIQVQAAQIAALASKMGPQGQAAIKAAIQALPQPLQRGTSYFIRQVARQEPTM